MTITNWKTHQLLNARQVAALLGQNPYHEPSQWEGVELPQPYAEGPLWSADQIRPLIAAHQDRVANRRTKELKWKDSELLTTKVCAALHYPVPSKKNIQLGILPEDKGVQETTFNSYVRRTIVRREEGKDSTNEAPLPVKEIMDHPLWDPREIREYLINRPGPGYHVSGDTRRGYRGGRVPVGAARSAG